MARYYVGYKNGTMEVFTSEILPTEDTHGHQYNGVCGPFRTKRAALFLASCGHNNPHVQCVSDAERISKQLAV